MSPASIHLAIEYDGAYWHRVKQPGELIKNARAEYLGITLIRILKATLSRLTDTDFLIEKSKDFNKTTMGDLLSHVFHRHLLIDIGDRLAPYLKLKPSRMNRCIRRSLKSTIKMTQMKRFSEFKANLTFYRYKKDRFCRGLHPSFFSIL